MNVKIKKIILTLTSLILIFSLPIYSNAFSMDTIFSGANTFIESGNNSDAEGVSEGDLKNLSNSVSNILLTIALVVTFISIAVMGVSFAMQTVEEKAKIKESMIPWVIGIFVSFGAYGIWKITMGVFYNINDIIS